MRNIIGLISKQIDINDFSSQKIKGTISEISQTSVNEMPSGQKVFAQNLQAKGIDVDSNLIAKIAEKSRCDELADAAFANFIKIFDGKTADEAKAILAKILDGNDFEFIKAFSSNIRTIDKKIQTLKTILEENNYRSLYMKINEHYEKYLQSLLDDKNVSVEKMYSIRPDWTVTALARKLNFNNPFSIGEIPNNFISKEGYEKLALFLRENNYGKADNIPNFVADGKIYEISSLKGGQSKYEVFKIKNGEKKFVLKLGTPVNVDQGLLAKLNCKSYPDRTPFMDFYLTYNKCKNAPQLHYYSYNPDKKICSTFYEYIDGEGVKYPKNWSDLSDLNALKVNFNDTVGENNIIYRDNIAHVVDNDHSFTRIPSDITPRFGTVEWLFKPLQFN